MRAISERAGRCYPSPSSASTDRQIQFFFGRLEMQAFAVLYLTTLPAKRIVFVGMIKRGISLMKTEWLDITDAG